MKRLRFQLAIPSPLAPTHDYIVPRKREQFPDVFAVHLIGEAQQIAAALPNDRVALQWDVLQEILIWENYLPDRPDTCQEQMLSVLGRIGDAVPAVSYTNLTLNDRLPQGAGKLDVYLNVQKLFNEPAPPANVNSTPVQMGLLGGFAIGDDPIGCYNSFGLRFRFGG